MKDTLHLPWAVAMNGRIIDSRQRAIGAFLDVDQGRAAAEKLNETQTAQKPEMPPMYQSPPRGLHLKLAAWLEAKKLNAGGIREKEKELIGVAEEWIGKV